MFSNCLLRLVLVAALVFAQAAIASHEALHEKNRLADCQLCLHASAAGAALPATETGPCAMLRVDVLRRHPVAPGASRSVPRSHPARAPPVFPA